MASVSNDETVSVVMHAAFAAPDEKMPGLPHRASAVHVGGANARGTVRRRGSEREFVAVSSDAMRE